MLNLNDREPNECAVVLLSSGLDSTVNIFAAKKVFGKVIALTFDYGQKAAAKEIEHSLALCEHLNIERHVIALPWFSNFSTSALINKDIHPPGAKTVLIDDASRSHETAKAVWVPNRNGIFLNIAAGFAEAYGAQYVVPGFNIEEAATFPDNSIGFMSAIEGSLKYSTANQVKVQCFTADLTKTQIVQLGGQLEVPFEKIWPCYLSGEKPCGDCESCLRFERATREAEL